MYHHHIVFACKRLRFILPAIVDAHVAEAGQFEHHLDFIFIPEPAAFADFPEEVEDEFTTGIEMVIHAEESLHRVVPVDQKAKRTAGDEDGFVFAREVEFVHGLLVEIDL